MINKAQSTLEAMVLIIVITAGLLAMRGFLGRSIQGNWKGNADQFSEGQFEPGVSRETSTHMKDGQPAIVFHGSNISAEVTNDGTLGNYNLAEMNPQVVKINGWGEYNSEASDD